MASLTAIVTMVSLNDTRIAVHDALRQLVTQCIPSLAPCHQRQDNTIACRRLIHQILKDNQLLSPDGVKVFSKIQEFSDMVQGWRAGWQRWCLCLLGLASPSISGWCQTPPTTAAPQPADNNSKMKRLATNIQIDMEKKEILLDAEVVLREGPLELLLCKKGSKEHESILAVDVDPRTFQTALLLAGAKPGTPAQFEPEFQPPKGHKVEITLTYQDSNQGAQASQNVAKDWRHWVRNASTGMQVDADFVFTGAMFVKLPDGNYVWNGEDLICLANFSSSIIDVAIKSSKNDSERLFEAWTERIPARGTKVTVRIKPIATLPTDSPSASTPSRNEVKTDAKPMAEVNPAP